MRHVRGLLILVPCFVLPLVGCGDDGATQGDAASKAAEAATPPADGVDPALAQIDAFIAEKKAAKLIDDSFPNWKSSLPKPPQLTFTPGRTYFWDVTTNKGEFRVRLMPDVAPMHVSSILYLSRLGFYDGTVFHRVIQNFMAQGGDPLGNGMGGPGYRFGGEFKPGVVHDRPYLLSTANTPGQPNSDGSQFFITFVPTPHLDGKHTIAGEVVEGTETIKTLESFGATGDGPPRVKLTIEKATVSVE